MQTNKVIRFVGIVFLCLLSTIQAGLTEVRMRYFDFPLFIEQVDGILQGKGDHHTLSITEKFNHVMDKVLKIRNEKTSFLDLDPYFAAEFISFTKLKDFISKNLSDNPDLYLEYINFLRNSFDFHALIKEQAQLTLDFLESASTCKTTEFDEFKSKVYLSIENLVNSNDVGEVMNFDTGRIVRLTYQFDYHCVFKLVNFMSFVSSFQTQFSN